MQGLAHRQPQPVHEFFTAHSLTKLREFYSAFRAVSETYSIDNEEFAELFGQRNHEIFQLMDTDDNLLIDGLELFCVMALLSAQLAPLSKVKFLFGIFDFNELRSLSRIDLEFLLASCCSGVGKAMGVRGEDPEAVE